MLCDYGCNQKANYTLKNGKHCCSKHTSSCPAIKLKNSNKQKYLYENGIKDAKLIYQNKSNEAKEKMKWNKGLTKFTDERVKLNGQKNHERFINNPELHGSFYGKTHTKETKSKIAKTKSKNYNYNIDRHGGKGKKGYYKGYFCSSTYELAYVIYCLDHNIYIERNTKGFEYEYKGKKHLYYPDFIVNDEYIEIKGYWKELVDIKASAVKDKPIKILYYKDLKYVFDYIKETYNKIVDKNISDLYEPKSS